MLGLCFCKIVSATWRVRILSPPVGVRGRLEGVDGSPSAFGVGAAVAAAGGVDAPLRVENGGDVRLGQGVVAVAAAGVVRRGVAATTAAAAGSGEGERREEQGEGAGSGHGGRVPGRGR